MLVRSINERASVCVCVCERVDIAGGLLVGVCTSVVDFIRNKIERLYATSYPCTEKDPSNALSADQVRSTFIRVFSHLSPL